jgi:Icc-related predicted phosphoesterase
MGLFGKKGGGGKRIRIFYMTDVHGSERTYRKFVNAAKFYKVDHLIMGGDIEGKFLVPIVDEGGGHYRVTLQEEHFTLNGDDELGGMKERIETLGFYYVIVNEEEIRAMQEDKSLVDAAFKREAHARLERWIDLADERLADTDIKMYVTGGNDDPQELIDTLEEKQSERVINCEGRIVMLGDIFPMGELRLQQPDAMGHAA